MYRKESRLHGLVNNAGIMATPYEESVDNYEAQFQVSHNSITAMIWTNTLFRQITSPTGF